MNNCLFLHRLSFRVYITDEEGGEYQALLGSPGGKWKTVRLQATTLGTAIKEASSVLESLIENALK
jgi:hypothetical protein